MPTVTCMGESFETWPSISAMAYVDFARSMKTDENSVSPDSVLALMDLLQDCLLPEEWDRFQQVTRSKRAGFEDLMNVIKAMVEAQADRPTGQPTDSSAGLPTTDQKSESTSANKVVDMFPGRPDKQAAVLRTLTG